MSKLFYASLLLLAMALTASTIGCQSAGGGDYSDSGGHAGHSH